MKCWPLTVIRTSALLPANCARELTTVHETRKLSETTTNACWYVTRCTKPIDMTGLIISISKDDPVPKFSYIKKPPLDQWIRLERVVVIDMAGDGLAIVMSTLH